MDGRHNIRHVRFDELPTLDADLECPSDKRLSSGRAKAHDDFWFLATLVCNRPACSRAFRSRRARSGFLPFDKSVVMHVSAVTFWAPKEGNRDTEYEDAFFRYCQLRRAERHLAGW